MEDIGDETDLGRSAAAEVNHPPTGTHDGGHSLHDAIDAEWADSEQSTSD